MSTLTQFLYKPGMPIVAAGGTVDVITATYAPVITLVDQLVVAVVSLGANTVTTPSFAPNSLTARTIVKRGGVALVANDLPAALGVYLLEYNLANTRWELLNPAVAGPISAITSGTIIGVPISQNSQSAAYTTVLADAGKHILHPTADNNARTFTIDSNANVAYVVGTTITFINQINTVTIAITSDTMTLSPAGTTGSRTLAANGLATAIKVSTTGWVISGTGLT